METAPSYPDFKASVSPQQLQQLQTQPVCLTPEEVAASRENKKHAQRTSIRQQPVYKDASNLLFVITQLTQNCPKKLRITIESLDSILNDILVNIGMAWELPACRFDAISQALSLTYCASVKCDILLRLGYMSRRDNRMVAKLCKRLQAQLAGWRASTVRVQPGHTA